MNKLDRATEYLAIDWLQWGEKFDEHRAEIALKYIRQLKAENKRFREALEYYANEKNWYLQKDLDTGAEVRRSIEYFDTESFGYQESPESKNILKVLAGKTAREALKESE